MAAEGDDERRARWTVTAEAAAVAPARHRVVSWLASSDLPRPVVEDALLVLSELVTNAVQASTDPDAKVRIHLSCTKAGCRITVADSGPGFSRRPITNGDALRDDGRGLAVVRRVAAEVVVRRRATGWTVVSAVLPIHGSGPAARAKTSSEPLEVDATRSPPRRSHPSGPEAFTGPSPKRIKRRGSARSTP